MSSLQRLMESIGAFPEAKHCFIVSNNQINAILSNILSLSDVEKTKMARNLVTLNILAYNDIYKDDKVELAVGSAYRYTKPSKPFSALESLKLLDCLEFNIASLKDHKEFPDFERIASMKSSLIKLIDGYSALRWSIK